MPRLGAVFLLPPRAGRSAARPPACLPAGRRRKEKTKENNHKELPVCFLLFFYFFLEESEGREMDFTSVLWLQQFTGNGIKIVQLRHEH
uniref:uncharacterized protein LOC107000514 isoform X2 n=1 Tax=Macaca mulatta TaxID=9544 RepID=UPI0007328A41|nr:uncharacterized protein LOC107000514 isoform X2 [Macaca mulatta]